ncbi:MAG: dihydrofolate reductase family protein [Chitinophagaceae bacterium]|jgi:dihydrofolate reductase|nr:dihydrofolate reductase family protein [Chitinophagaceae bacterium]
MNTERKVILYIAMSVDGFIAGPQDDLSFLNVVAKEGEDYGYNGFTAMVDTVIMGRKTYDWVMKQVPEFPHADKQTFILTRTEKPSEGNVQFYAGSLTELMATLRNQTGKNIFVDGGADVVNSLLQINQIDEMIISIIPSLVGDGTPLFKPGRSFKNLKLTESKAFESGLVQLHYEVVR